MTNDVTWLVDEICELLDAGRVGLYEFVEALHERSPATPVRELRPVARRALEELRHDPELVLGWFEWPEPAPVRLADWAEVYDEAFDAIGDDLYLGVVRSVPSK